jgi:hypothetical protein
MSTGWREVAEQKCEKSYLEWFFCCKMGLNMLGFYPVDGVGLTQLL